MNLITGASGFLGMNLAWRLLGQGEKVRVLVRDPSRIAPLLAAPGSHNLEVRHGELADRAALDDACRGVRRIYHAAALVSSWSKHWKEAWRTNIGGSAALLSAARQAGVERVVYTSTVDAFGMNADGRPANEATPWNYDALGLSNPYSDSKHLAHRLAEKAAAHQDVVLVCPGYMIGPRDYHISSNRLVLTVARGGVPFAPRGGNSFVHVEDAVDALIAAAQKGQSGRSYIIAAEDWTYPAFFGLVSQAMGRPRQFPALPAWVAAIGGVAGELAGCLSGREPDIHRHTVAMGNIRHYYNGNRACQELGISYRRVEAAVRECLDWFRAQGSL